MNQMENAKVKWLKHTRKLQNYQSKWQGHAKNEPNGKYTSEKWFKIQEYLLMIILKQD